MIRTLTGTLPDESVVTRYASSGDVRIAYQKIGNHDDHLLIVAGWVSNVEEVWNIPHLAAWLKYLSTIISVIIFDKRGTGLSDRVSEDNLPCLDTRIQDLLAVLADLKLEKVNLFGLSEGGAMALKFANEFPGKVNKIILFAAFAKWVRSDDYPYGETESDHLAIRDYIYENWGSPIGAKLMAPNFDDEFTINQWARFLRSSASPSSARAFYTMNMQIDIRPILGNVSAPTMILHRQGDKLIEWGHSLYLNEKIPGSELKLLHGNDHLPWFSATDAEMLLMYSFLKGPGNSGVTRLPVLRLVDIGKLYEIKDHLDRCYRNVDISIKMLAKAFGINEYKLKTGFKSLFGVPVISYLTRTRMQNARSLLLRKDETVLSVAEKVGYGYANNFTAAFKKTFGMSPTEFVRKNFPKGE